MTDWIKNNIIEIIGAVLAFIYLILEIKRKWIFWIVGIFSSAFYVYIYFHAGLYAEAGLNFYYILMSVYGLYCWKFASKYNNDNSGFHHLDTKTMFVLLLLFIITFGITIIILHQFPGAQMPVPDALIALLSIIATWMSAKKMVECWHVWIFANIFATGLYITQKLYPTAILFIFYSIFSFVGLVEWRKMVKQNDTAYTKI